jgi:hypothetical protein
MSNWPRGDKIGLITLIAAILATIAAWVVVPEFRKWTHLDKTDEPSIPSRSPVQEQKSPQHSESTNTTEPGVPLIPKIRSKLSKSQTNPHSAVPVTELKQPESKPELEDVLIDPDLRGFWVDPTVSANNMPIFMEFRPNGAIRARSRLSDRPWDWLGFVWFRTGNKVRLFLGGTITYEGTINENSIEGTMSINGQKYPWRLERVGNDKTP